MNIDRELRRARQHASEWILRQDEGELRDEEVLALGYIERLRLGLGSPFRLIEHVLHDPRLDQATREQLAWALLARTRARTSYDVDPPALMGIGTLTRAGSARAAGGHLQLIERAIRGARDPRGGELALRLAYQLAAAEGSVLPQAPLLAAQAAALLRDRELAQRDADRLLQQAEAIGSHPLTLLSRWREQRLFEVEAPPLAPRPASIEREAVRLLPQLLAAIQSLELRPECRSHSLHPALSRPVLHLRTALRLTALADSFNPPPQAPVEVIVRSYTDPLLERESLAPGERNRLRRFATRARDEEHFAAEYVIAWHSFERNELLSLSAQSVAAALRSFAQEQVWYVGATSPPRPHELDRRFGFAAVDFDARTPVRWRPYYRRMLESALTDLQTVMPALNTDGLRIRFARPDSGPPALAYHTALPRAVYLPPATSAGTLAHEIAHDLDWQTARRKYRVRAGYATDLGARSTRRDGFAIAVQSMPGPEARGESADSSTGRDHLTRPAEVFARNFEWFVASQLAARGRSNGYLSSILDETLVGYGSAVAPDPETARAFVRVLTLAAPLPEEARQRYTERFAWGALWSPSAAIHHVLRAARWETHAAISQSADTDTPDAPGVPLTRTLDAARRESARLREVRTRAIVEAEGGLCGGSLRYFSTRIRSEVRSAIDLASDAALRGVLLQRAEDVAGRAGRAWMARWLYGPLHPGAEVDAETLPLLEELASLAAAPPA
ncbi:MAG TPA: hypothetical protein VGR27_12020, partial [Longimicrobiaceae bacterium]|nr:hypothetical protein [Longimicrobiaceae bacterium]